MNPLQTIVDIEQPQLKLSHNRPILLIGSCFTEHIGNNLANCGFNVMINPFGILYNPFSIADCLDRCIHNQYITANDLILHNEIWHSWYHHSCFSNSDQEQCLLQCNQSITDTHSFLQQNPIIILTLGTAWVYRYHEKIVANCHKIPNTLFTKELTSINNIVDRFQSLSLNDVILTISPIRHWADTPHGNLYTDAQGKVQAYDELKGDTTYITRGFLVMEGKLAGEPMAFIVNHWPSRAAGDPVRQRAGFQVRKLMDAILAQTPGVKIMVMGDMNDDPANKSMVEQLGCVSDKKDVKSERDMYNPWFNTLYKVGQGTLMYKGKWNLFDQIVLSGNMVGKDYSTLKYYQHAIFLRDYLFQQEGKFKGNPLRTHAGGVWLNGYSDHLPTQVYLLKEKK